MTFRERFERVKEMDEIVRNFDDETLVNIWLTLGCPDESDASDYAWFADEDEFSDLTALFERLCKAAGR